MIHNQLQNPEARAETEQQERLVNFRVSASWMGIMLLLLGLGFCLAIFFQVYRFIQEPRDLSTYVDRWEVLVRGKVPTLSDPAEDDAPSPDEEEDATPPRSTPREISIARPMIEMLALSSRPFAIVILLFLTGVLVRIAIMVVDVGTKLMSFSVSEQHLLKRLVDELRKPK